MIGIALDLGATREALLRMSFAEQMVYVEKYFKRKGFNSNKPVSLGRAYTAVIGCYYPQKNICYIKARHPKVFLQNPHCDANKDGIITPDEAATSEKFREYVKDYETMLGI